MTYPFTTSTEWAEPALARDDLQLWLDRTSRTFALTLRLLGEPLRTYTSAAYLLCRIVDTVEDCETLPTEAKCRYLLEFSSRLVSDPLAGPLSGPNLFTDPQSWEERLTRHESDILTLIHTFPSQVRATIFRYAGEMAEGMAMFLEQQDQQGRLQFESDEQLDQYCYYVAGTVGLMLNDLFADVSERDKSEAKNAAVELGIGLQLTNIVKDIQKDLLRNVRYCPSGNSPHWPDPAAPPPANPTHREVFTLASATISHLTCGREYLLSLETNLKQYKLFCVANYLMAWKTLESCLREPQRTARGDGGAGSKISRFSVYATLLESRGCVLSDNFLNWRTDRLKKSCTELLVAAGRG
jgi:farnesyl-diphosphate farnesyltransferase